MRPAAKPHQDWTRILLAIFKRGADRGENVKVDFGNPQDSGQGD